MERRFLLFVGLAFAILSLHFMLTAPKQAPKKPPEVAAEEDGEEPQEGEGEERKEQPQVPEEGAGIDPPIVAFGCEQAPGAHEIALAG